MLRKPVSDVTNFRRFARLTMVQKLRVEGMVEARDDIQSIRSIVKDFLANELEPDFALSEADVQRIFRSAILQLWPQDAIRALSPARGSYIAPQPVSG